MSTLASGAKAHGQEVLDDISAAQQYILDLQVLFYSLKTVSANAQKEAEEAGRRADASAGDRIDGRAGEGAGNEALQRQVETLTQQLEEERRERARLQEQYDQAVAMLRKSYGQIVDDYLFATEQLHARTKQLEGLMEVTSAGAMPTLADPAKPHPARAVPIAREDGERGAEEHPPRTLRHEAPSQREEALSEAWGSLNPTFNLGRSSFRGDVSAGTWEAAAAAAAPGTLPSSPLVPAASPDITGAVAAPGPHHHAPSRHLPGGGIGGNGATAATAGELAGSVGAAIPGPVSSRTSSQGSTGAAGTSGGIAAGVTLVNERPQLGASGPQPGLTTLDQPLPSQRSKQLEGGSSGFLEVRQVSAPSSATPAPQARSPRAKASSRLRLPGGGGILGAPDISPLSSPPGEAPPVRLAFSQRDWSGSASAATGTAPAQPQVLASSSSAPSPAPSLWGSRKEEPPPGSVSGARGSAGALPGDAGPEAVLANELRRSLAGRVAECLSPSAAIGTGQRRDQAVASESGFAHPHVAAAALAAAPRSERPSEPAAAAAAASLASQPSIKSTSSADVQAAPSTATATTTAASLHGSGRVPQPMPPVKLPNGDPDLTDLLAQGRAQQRRDGSRSQQRERERERARENERERERERTSRARENAQGDPDVVAEPAAPLPTSCSAQSAARAAAAELGTAAAAAAASRHGLDGLRSARAPDRRQNRRDDRSAVTQQLPGSNPSAATTTSGPATVQRSSPQSQLTPTRNQAAQGRDRAHRHAGAGISAAEGAEDAPTSASKRLRRSVSSPAERSSSRRTGAAADGTEASPVRVSDAATDNTSHPGGARRDGGTPGSRRASSRSKSRPVPPADPKTASCQTGEPKMPASGAAAEQPQEFGGGGGNAVPLSRRRSLRHLLSVHALKPRAPTGAAVPESDGSSTAQRPVQAAAATAGEATKAAKAAPPPAAVAAAAALDARGGSSARLRDPEAGAGNSGRVGVGPASDRPESSAGATTHASGGVAPLELDEYLARMRARYSEPYRPAAGDAAAPVEPAGVSYREPAAPHGHEQVGRGAGEDAASGYGIYRAAQSSARATSTVSYSAAGSSGGGGSGGGGRPARPAAMTASVLYSGRDATSAAPAATPVAGPGREVSSPQRQGSGDGCSSGSSASIEGLASLVRSLRKRLAGMQQEYGITADDNDDDVDVLTDDAGVVDDGGDTDADAGVAPHDWLTDDDNGIGADGDGDLFDGLGFDAGDSIGDEAADEGDEFVLGRHDGEEDGPDYNVYGVGAEGATVFEDSDGSGIEDADENGNDVLRDTFSRFFRGMSSASFEYGTAAPEPVWSSTAAAAAPTAAAAATAGGPYGCRRDAADEVAPPSRQRRAPRDGLASSTSEDGDGNLPYSNRAAAGGGADSTEAGTPGASRAAASFGPAGAAGGAADSRGADGGVGRGAGHGGGSGGFGWAAAGAAAGSKASSPAFAHRSGSDARASLASLLDAVNAGKLGGALGGARTGGGGGGAAAAASVHPSKTSATHDRDLRHDRAGAATAVPWATAAQTAAACWAGATGPGSGPEVHSSWSGAGAGGQPDRVPPPDQTSPRKDSAAAAFGGMASKGKGLGDRLAPEPGTGPGSAPQGHGTAADDSVDASFTAAQWRQHGSDDGGSSGGGGGGDGAGFVATNAAEAGDTAGAPAPPPPPLQNLRSEAMFARIKQQLDELQSSFSAGLGLSRGADDAAGGGGAGTRGAERRSAATAARPGDAWRDTSREPLGSEASSSTGGGSGDGSDGARGRGRRSGDDPVGSNSSGNSTRVDSLSEGGLQQGSRPMGMTAGGAAQVRMTAWDEALNGAFAASLSGRGDADGGQHHHGADARSRMEAEGVAMRRKSLSASLSAGITNGSGSGAAVRPHGLVLHGEGDR